MHGDTVAFDLDLAAGDGLATAWGCDLTEKYVEINGKYTT
jgi:glutamate N-acetyltransferase/amino-acid N-acetyltransferase